MQPNQLATLTISDAKTPAQKRAEGGWAARHGMHWPKGTELPETLAPACPRVRVADLPEGHLKQSHIEHLEHNQQLKSCCRHPTSTFFTATSAASKTSLCASATPILVRRGMRREPDHQAAELGALHVEF